MSQLSLSDQRISVGGPPGSGKTILMNWFASKGLRTMSGGRVFRDRAAALGKTLVDLEIMAKENPSYDREVDEAVRAFAAGSGGWAIESRLAWFHTQGSSRILLTCAAQERYRRVAAREKISLKDARHEVVIREAVSGSRFLSLYGIENPFDPAHFDLVFDTTALKLSDVPLVGAVILDLCPFFSQRQLRGREAEGIAASIAPAISVA